MRKTIILVMMTTLLLTLIAVMSPYSNNVINAQTATRNISTLLKNYVGQEYTIRLSERGEGETAILKEVNLDYLVFEPKRLERTEKLIIPLNGISLCQIVQLTGQKESLEYLKTVTGIIVMRDR